MSDKWFRSTVFKGGIDHVELEEHDDIIDGKIQGVAVATEGLAVGHNVYLDSDFIKDVARMGNERGLGLKARFGHPSMSSDAVGTFAGRFNNFRVVNDIVRADLDLAESARKSPNGDLKEYILSLAAESPDMFGISIVFTPGKEFQKDDNGKIFDSGLFENDKKTFIEIKNLHAADVVDEPAANTGLFSQFSSEMIAGKVADFLDINPQIHELIEAHPDIISPFLERYNKQKEGIKMDKKTELEEVVAELPAKVETAAAKEPVQFSERELFSIMKERFGLAFAAQAFDEGLTLEEATEKHVQGLTAKVEELSTKLEATIDSITAGTDALITEAVDELDDDLQGVQDAKLQKFQNVLSGGLARFASGIKLQK